MKFTKVDRMRSAVSRYETDGGRGFLYEAPKTDKRQIDIEKQLGTRIQAANKLYNVFFVSDVPAELEEHFKRVVTKIGKSRREKVGDALREYSGYEQQNTKTGKSCEKKIENFSYRVSGNKNLKNVMMLHIQERMDEFWFCDKYRDATADILTCLCDGASYINAVTRLSSEVLDTFWNACRDCKMAGKYPLVYVDKNIERIPALRFRYTPESLFTEFIKQVVKACDDAVYQNGDSKAVDSSLDTQINKIERWRWLTIYERDPGTKRYEGKRVDLSAIRWSYASETRLQAMLVRMRKSLKRGTDAQTAIELMQALFQMDGRTLSSTINSMKADEETHAQLKHFIDSVNRDYYKVNVLKSLRHLNVRMQPEQGAANNLILTGMENGKKRGLYDTLLSYAASAGESDRTLLAIKKILFSYFPTECDRNKFLQKETLWAFPNADLEVYFDYDFEDNDSLTRTLRGICGEQDRTGSWKASEAKQRIKYVNYGRFLQLLYGMKNVPEGQAAFAEYWLRYIKVFVEKHYTGKRKISRRDCLSANMMAACWYDIVRHICGKYIDIGKAVYHFAMPEDVRPVNHAQYGEVREEYRDGISSFDYEVIKAEETLQRDISTAVMAASSAYTRAVLDEKKSAGQEDILMMGKEELAHSIKQNAADQVLRFYGGKSTIQTFTAEIWAHSSMQEEFILEVKEHLAFVRNANFHYANQEEKIKNIKFASLLMENDAIAYADIVRKRYYSNNAAMFYGREQIAKLVEKLYGQNQAAESQIPAFRTIWKKDARAQYLGHIAAGLKKGSIMEDALRIRKGKNSSELRVVYDGALYFLLKEIYYRDYILNDKAKQYFYAAVDAYKNENGKDRKHGRAATNFAGYVDKLKKAEEDKIIDTMSFGAVCQSILQEYSQQNAKNKDEEIYKHFKMLFPVCVRKGFQKYVEDYYNFILSPEYHEVEGEQDYLENVEIGNPEHQDIAADERRYAWFTLAHFIHPKQLNLLAGDFKNYIQYRENVYQRLLCADQLKTDAEKERAESGLNESIQRAYGILNVLEFVRGVSGRVSACFGDYYDDEEGYADYLGSYIAFERQPGKTAFQSLKYFCCNILPDEAVVDIYADAENPKILRNVEISRMYAGGDLSLPGRKKVQPDEIQDYYAQKDTVEKILSAGLCKDKTEQEAVIAQQQRKNRLMLNDVTDLYGMINDLLSQLTSLSYLRERDEMYLYLGFYYMALRSEDGWDGEELRSAEFKKCSIGSGLVLYQVVSLFEHGLRMPGMKEEEENGNKQMIWSMQGGGIPLKIYLFSNAHKTSFSYVRRLLGKEEEKDNKIDAAVDLRNYVDHAKYYANHDKSIAQLYSEFYRLIFPYSTSLRNSVPYIFKKILERNFMECNVDFIYGTAGEGFQIKNLTGTEFTYKLQGGGTYRAKARNKEFLENAKRVLEYRTGAN